jgi:tetratricopeptide (TPR) repeat protein
MSADFLRSLHARATKLLHEGNIPEAIDAHRRLLQLRPELADSWYNLAYLQHRARQFEAALQSYQQALRRGVAQPEEAHLNRGAILADHLERADEAEKEFRQALKLNARYVPALVNLGNLHEQRGEREPALAAYEQALALDADNAIALARLPNLKRLGGADDPVIARLQQALRRPGITPAEQADLGFGLGKALDGVGAFDAAFSAYCAANVASRVSAPAARYDRAAHEDFVDRLISAFNRPVEVATPAAGKPPIFICGMFRSGSTLMEQILASHPRVTAGGEIDLIPHLAMKHLVPAGDAFAPLTPETLAQMRTTYQQGVTKLFRKADIITDKRPDNFLYIGLIKTLFPHAKIVHTMRSPLDNCLSVFFLHLDHAMAYALDLEDVGHWYCQYHRLMTHWKRLYSDDIHDVAYDTLVSALRPTVERVLAYCGLEWNDACLAFHQTRAQVKTPSAWQVRQPLYSHACGRWRNYERHLGPLCAALGDLAQAGDVTALPPQVVA